MKRIWLFALLAALLLLTLPAGAETVLLPGEEIADLADDGETLYARARSGAVYAVGPDGRAALVARGYPDGAYSGLAVSGGALYTVEKSAASFTLIDARGGDAPLDGVVIPALTDALGAGEDAVLSRMRDTPFGLFFTAEADATDAIVLCRLDTGTRALSLSAARGLLAYCVTDTGEVLVLARGEKGRVLAALDWDTGALTPLCAAPADAVGLAAGGESIYCFAGAEVLRVSDGALTHVGYMDTLCDSRLNGALLNGGMLACAQGEKIALRRAEAAPAVSGALRVLNDNALNPGYQAFARENPGVSVAFEQLAEYPDTMELARRLLTDELQFDVFRLCSSDFDVETLARKGYLADLSGDKALWDAVQSMEGALSRSAVFDDRLYAVPCLLYGNFTAYYGEAFEKAGLTQADVPRDLQSFYGFILAWKGAKTQSGDTFCLFNLEHSGLRAFFLKELLKENIAYCARRGTRVAFDTPLFRSLLGMCGAVAEAVNAEEMQGYTLFDLGASRVVQRGILALAYDPAGEPVVPVTADLYVISGKCKNLEAALAYIRACVAAYTPEQRLQLYPAYTEPVRSEAYRLYMRGWEQTRAVLESELAGAQDAIARRAAQDALDAHIENRDRLAPAGYDISPEDVAYYKANVAPYLFVPNAAMMRLVVYDTFTFDALISQYLDGKSPPDRFIADMDGVCAMIEKESK